MKPVGRRAFGYIRVSGQGQVKKDGPTRQRKAIRDYTEANGIILEKTFTEKGVSGTIKDRPALAEMMLSLEENGLGVGTVIIEKMDRLARDLMIQERIVEDLRSKGFDLVSATEGEDILSQDPTRTLVRQVLGAIAEYDKAMTVQKLRAARERVRARQGKCEGRKGYAELKPEILKEIRRLRRKPRYEAMRRKTYKEIADILNSQGHTTLASKPFTGQTIQNILR